MTHWYNIKPLTTHYAIYNLLPDEAMQVMVTKILELSSQRVEGLPEDFVDLASDLNTSGNNSNYSQMRDMANKGYTRSGNGITVAIKPKPNHDKTFKKTGSNCC